MGKAKRLLAGILAAVVAFSSDGIVMAANSEIPEPEQEKVIEISSVKKLMKVADDLSGNYRLTKDIDLSDVEWEALGSKDEPFTGSFDGDGHVISHMSMEVSDTEEDTYIGLFGVMDNASISNVALEEMSIKGRNIDGIYAGAIAGKMTNSVIKDCNVDGEIVAEDTNAYTIGGLIGAVFQNNSVSKIEYNVSNSVSDVDIILDKDCYGEAGELAGYVQNGAIFKNSYTYKTDYDVFGAGIIEGTNCKALSDSTRKKENAYVGFDFENVWKLSDNGAKLIGQKEIVSEENEKIEQKDILTSRKICQLIMPQLRCLYLLQTCFCIQNEAHRKAVSSVQ